MILESQISCPRVVGATEGVVNPSYKGLTMVRIFESSRSVERGMSFGRWTALGKPFSVGTQNRMVVVKCNCGNVSVVQCGDLSSGFSTQCQKCGAKSAGLTNAKHGWSKNRLFKIWKGMKERCHNTKHHTWNRYGGRGILVCQAWQESFEVFRDWATNNGYAESLQIDRINNDGNYEPENCRWITRTDNARNKRNNVFLTAFGETKTLVEWIEDERCVVGYNTLYSRLSCGWPVEKSLTTPKLKRRQAI